MRFIPVCRAKVCVKTDCEYKNVDEEDCAGCIYLDYIEEQKMPGLGKL